MADRTLAFLQKMRDRHGDVFTIRLVGGQSLLVVSDPGLAKQVFNAPADVLLAGEGNRRMLGETLGENSLILLDGERHMSHRRLMLPPLHGQQLECQEETMRTLAQAHLDAWPTGEEIAALPRFRALALEIVLHALFDGDEERSSQLRNVLSKLLMPEAGAADAPLPPSIIRDVEGHIGEEVAARRLERSSRARGGMLSHLLEARHQEGSLLSDDEVRGELITLIVAGTATTASSLAWALERLTRTPAALERALAEATDEDGSYIDAVIHETLRMRPAVPMSGRLAKHAFPLGDRIVPAGTVIAVSALLIHHRPDIYKEPMDFLPERFLESRPGTYTWIPFGGGVRRCIGAGFALLEMRTILSALLSRMMPKALSAEPERMRSRGNALVPAGQVHITLSPLREKP